MKCSPFCFDNSLRAVASGFTHGCPTGRVSVFKAKMYSVCVYKIYALQVHPCVCVRYMPICPPGPPVCVCIRYMPSTFTCVCVCKIYAFQVHPCVCVRYMPICPPGSPVCVCVYVYKIYALQVHPCVCIRYRFTHGCLTGRISVFKAKKIVCVSMCKIQPTFSLLICWLFKLFPYFRNCDNAIMNMGTFLRS